MHQRAPRFRIGSALLGLLAAAFCGQSRASADDRSALETIVVTGSRLEQHAADMTQSFEVIDRARIEALQFANVTELLRHIAGINIIQQGARGGVTSAVLRGAEPNFTVVLIDGIKVNDSTNTRGGSYDFSYLDLASIERVEIVRGPLSAVYGSDALAGVVNIVTRDAGPGVEIRGETGGHGLRAGSVRAGAGSGALGGMVGVHALSEDGDIEGARYEDFGIDAAFQAEVGDESRLGARLRLQDADSAGFPEDSGGPQFAVIRTADERSVREAHLRLYAAVPLGSSWDLEAAVSRYEREEALDSPGIAPGVFDGVPPNSSRTDFTRDQASLNAARRVADRGAVVVGVEWQGEEGDSSGEIDFGFPVPTDFRLRRDTFSVFAEGQWQADPLVVQASVRRDDPDEISAETSARLGAIARLPGAAGSLRVNWGQAFKAPSFFALAHPLVGNPDLASETATSVDVGYRRDWGPRAGIEISVYRNDFENLIDFDPELFTSVNRSKVVTQGAELTARVPLAASVSADLHLTYADAEIRDSDARLRGRPKWRGGAALRWDIDDDWQFAASILALDEFWEVSIPTGGVFLEGYTRVDLALTWQASDRLNVGFAIDNATDADYQEAVGFPAAGRRGRISAVYRFGESFRK